MALLDIIQRATRLTPTVSVGVSCGRDSLATLDLCKTAFANVSAYFMYLVPGLSFQEQMLGYLERRYEVKILRVPGVGLSIGMRYANFAMHNQFRLDTPELSILDVENYVRQETGCEWIATGERKQDSLQRRGMLSACNGIDETRKRIYPLSDWTGPNVVSYLKLRQVPLPSDYRLWGRSFGWFSEPAVVAIKREYPSDYAKILEVFPFVEAVAARAEFRERRAQEQVSDLQS